MRKKYIASLLSVTALAAGLATPVSAQQPAPANPAASVDTQATADRTPAQSQVDRGAADQDIIVTARRVEERLQDVPISITVFNQGQLNNRNVVSGSDLATYTPSLTANARFGPNSASFAIRGFTQEIRTAPSVGVYFAEVTAPRAGLIGTYAGEGAGPGSFFDLQNVQVLKGPQGTLFGRNTTGGAILLVPQRPTDKFEGYVEGTLGNLDLQRLQGVLNVPVSEAIRLRFGGDYEKRDGYLKNLTDIGPRTFGDVDRYALRASALIDLTDMLENYTVGYLQRSDDNGTIPKMTQCNAANRAFGAFACAQIARQADAGFWTVQNAIPNAVNINRQWQVINQTKWQVTDTLALRNIASYGEFRQQQKSASFGEYFPVAALANAPLFFNWSYPANTPTGPGGLSAGGELLPRANQWTATEEFQLVGSMEKLDWQAGVYYERSKSIGQSGSNSTSFSACPGDPPAIETGQCVPVFGPASVIFSPAINRSRFRDIGTYAQATYALTDQLKLTGGIRYTWDKVEGFNVAAQQRTQGGPLTCAFGPIIGPTTINPATGTRVAAPITDLNQCLISPTTKSDAPTWVVDLDYFPIDDVMIYAKYSRGYRQGTVNIFSPPVAPFDVVQPEKVDVYEIGTKTSWRGEAPGTFNLSLFYNDFTNQQLLLGLEDRPGITPGFPLGNRATSTATIVNVGASRIQGFEADGSIRLFRALTLNGSLAYLDTKVKSITLPTIPSEVPYNTLIQTVFAGSQLPFTPKWKTSITAALDLPVPETIGTMTVSSTFSYASRLLNQAGNANGTPPGVLTPAGFVDNIYLPKVSLFNFNFNWNGIAGAPVDLSLFVVNTFNKKYYVSYNNRASVGFASQIPGERRTAGVRLRYRFGS